VHNSRLPLNRLTLTLTLTFTSDQTFISERDMDFPGAKFGDFSFNRFGFIERTESQTESHTHTHRHTEADDRCTHATIVGVSEYSEYTIIQAIMSATAIVEKPRDAPYYLQTCMF